MGAYSMFNRVTLCGYVEKDPQIKNLPNGKIANLRLSTVQTWREKLTGEKKSKTEYHQVAIFGDVLVSVVERSIREGSLIQLEGQLESRQFTDKNGYDKHIIQVSVRPQFGTLLVLDKDTPDSHVRNVSTEDELMYA